jgi:hypothetical protein
MIININLSHLGEGVIHITVKNDSGSNFAFGHSSILARISAAQTSSVTPYFAASFSHI